MMTFTESVYGVLESKRGQRDSIVFTGCLTMLGVDCEIRQTVSKAAPMSSTHGMKRRSGKGLGW